MGVLYSDASLWIFDMSVQGDGKRITWPSIDEINNYRIMKGVSAILEDDNGILALKTNKTLWKVRKKWEHEKPFFMKNGIAYEKLMEGVEEFWVNPINNSQIYSLTENGELYGAGANAYGQLGVGFNTGTNKRAYQKLARVSESVVGVVTQSDWSDLRMRTMAIKDDRSLWLWGWDIRFGSTSSTNREAGEGFYFSNVPVRIMENVASAAISEKHSLVLKLDGSLWTWGYNHYGQLGIGNYEDMREAVKVMDNVTAVAANGGISFAVQADGSLWAWGLNESGELGTGDKENRTEPTRIMENVASITATPTCRAAVKQDGSVWIWGRIHCYNTKAEPILKPICIIAPVSR